MFFFFNDPAPTEIYTLSLHDALPIFEVAPVPEAPSVQWSNAARVPIARETVVAEIEACAVDLRDEDRKSTRLNSSHQIISYAVFCLKKKKKIKEEKYNKQTENIKLII